MAASAYFQDVQKLYIAYYQRPADPAGLLYWAQQIDAAGGDATAAVNAFGMAAESQALYGAVTSATIGDVIDKIYMAAFNRPAEQAGKDYWVGQFNAGAIGASGIAYAVVLGAQNTDLAVSNAKLAVANEFTKQVDGRPFTDPAFGTAPFNVTYAGDTDATNARDVLKPISDTVTLTPAEVTQALKDKIADPTDPINALKFALTPGTDTPPMTAGNDVITGAAGTLQSTDRISDASTTDSDRMDVSLNDATLTPTITNIEAVNLSWTGQTDAGLDLVNSAGNTFNIVAASNLAFNKAATFANVGVNNINFGNLVNTVTANGIETSKIDAGTATSVTLGVAAAPVGAAAPTATVKVNNDLTSFTNTVNEVTIDATKAVVITAAAGAQIVDKLTVTGASNVAYRGTVTGETIVKALTGGATLTVRETATAGAVNFANIQADVIELNSAATAVTAATGQTYTVNAGAAASLTSFTTTAADSTATVNVNLGRAVTSAAVAITDIQTLNLNVTAAASATLTTDAQNIVTVKGSGALGLTTAVGATAASIDASALTGAFTYTTNAVAAPTGVAGSATATNVFNLDTIVGAAPTYVATFVGGSAADTFNTASDFGVGTVTLRGGQGTDRLVVSAVSDFTAANEHLVLESIEELVVTPTSAFKGETLNGQAIKVFSDAAALAQTFTVTASDKTGVATAVTTDLSKLTFSTLAASNYEFVTIGGVAGNVVDTIKGTTISDVITANGAGDLLTGGGGRDVFVLATGDSAATAASQAGMDKISDFGKVTAAGAVDANQAAFLADTTASEGVNADVLTFGAGATILTGVASTALTGAQAAAVITGGIGNEVVTYSINNGVVTLGGTDAAKIDTMAEWIRLVDTVAATTAADVVAFQFGGNTYVFQQGATDDLVELTGITTTGLVTYGGTAAVGNIIVA